MVGTCSRAGIDSIATAEVDRVVRLPEFPEFRPVEFDDRELMEELFKREQPESCRGAFGS